MVDHCRRTITNTHPIVIALIVFNFYFLLSCAEPDDKAYKELDQTIISEFNNIKNDYMRGNLRQETYIDNLKSLSKKEDELFKKVHLHKFNDQTEYNYWYRGRLKFPSSIKMEIERLKGRLNDSSKSH